MSTSISRSTLLCSVFSSIAILSACSDKKAQPVSVNEIDRSEIPTDVVTNGDLSASNTDWTGWSADAEVTNGALAEFALDTQTLGSNSLKTSVINVEAESAPGEIQAGPIAVPVKPGQAYGVGAFISGTKCGIGKFVVHAAGDPENVLAEEEFFFNGALQTVNYYFQVPESGVTSVDLPVQFALADNIAGEFYLDKILTVPSNVPKPAAEGNVANNSNFEESNTDISVNGSWANAGSATFTLDTTEAQDGNNSVRIDFTAAGGGNPYDIEAGPVGVPVVDGWTYIFSAWIKNAEGDDGAKANFLIQHPTAYNVYEEQDITTTSEWQEVRFEVTITGTDVIRLYAQYNFAENANKTIYIDNIKLIPPDTCPYAPVVANLVSDNDALYNYDHVSNGGFEESGTEIPGWATQGSPTLANFDVQVTPPNLNKTLVYSDENSLKATINAVGNEPEDIQASVVDLLVTPGQTYIYSGFARGAPGAKANFTIALEDAPFDVIEEQLFTFTDILWHQVAFDFNVPEDATVLTAGELVAAALPANAVLTRVRMHINMSYPENVDRRIFLDNFTLLPNAVRNGDLEDSATEALGWTEQPSNGLATFALDTTQAHTGLNSLRVDVDEVAADANRWDIEAGVANIPVEGGRKYFVSARIKGDADTLANIFLGLPGEPYTEFGAVGGDSDDDDTLADGIEVTEEWQEVTFEANIPEGVEAVRLLARLAFAENSNKSIYLDSFRVVSQTPPPPKEDPKNVVANGGLETGLTTGWNGNNAAIAVTFNPEDVHSGDFALHVTDRTTSTDSAQFSLLDADLQKGGSYSVSSWVKVDGDTVDNIKLVMQISYNSGDPDVIDITATGDANTLDWTELSGEFDYAPDSTRTVTAVTIAVVADGAETGYFIDDLFVSKVLAESANLVTNGGLEVGKTDGWNANNATIAVTTSQAGIYSGNFGLHVTGRTANWNSAQYSLFEAGLEEGASYSASAWVKVDGDTADVLRMTLQITYEDDTSDYIGITASGEADTLGWTHLSGIFNFTPTKVVTDAKVYIEADGATTAYFIDELFVTKVFTVNGNLESGATTGWVGAGAQIAVTAAEAHSGNNSLHVTGRTANWNSAQFDLLSTGMEPGRTYQISGWVKIDGATPDNVKMTIELADDDNTDQYFTAAQSSDTLNWVKLSNTYTYAPDGEATVFKVYFEADGVNSAYYVDDLVITEVIPPANLITNGNLELGRPDGWNANNATIATTGASAGVHSGNFGLHVTGRTANWNSAQFGLMEAGLEEGATYTTSAWVKVDGATTDNIKLTLQITYEDATSEYIGITASGAADTLEWTKISGLFTYTPTGPVADAKVYIEADGATTAYFIDDLIIQRMFTPNGDLESGNATGWVGAGAQIAVTAAESISGTQSLHVTGRTANWNSAQYDLLASGMEAGQTYDISAWVKIEGDTADNIKMTVELVDEDDLTNQYMTIAQSADTLTWVRLSSRYTYAPGGPATTFKVYFEADGATSSYYIDNLVITEASEINPN